MLNKNFSMARCIFLHELACSAYPGWLTNIHHEERFVEDRYWAHMLESRDAACLLLMMLCVYADDF